MYAFGIDVSHYEWNVDWLKVYFSGVRFSFFKASQGIIKDERFDVHRAGARANGTPFGAYCFYDPRYRSINPKRQAEFFWNVIKDDPGELPLVVDIEFYTEGPWHGWQHWYDFLERLKELAPGREIMIYTGFYFWRDNGGPKWWDLPRHMYFSQYPLWLAFYPGGSHPPTTTPEAERLVPLTWMMKGWTFWQTSDQNTLFGVTNELGKPANVDYDFFNGDEVSFRRRFNIGGTTPPPSKNKFSQTINLGETTQRMKEA